MNLERLEQTWRELNQIGYSDKGVMRLAYTPQERQAVRRLAAMCEARGMSVRMDASGNLIARREGKEPHLPAVASGSHLDAVFEGGSYDGIIGVVAAFEAICSLDDQGIATKHPIELICFACEESSRFGVSTVGSKAMIGELDIDGVSGLQDRDGKTFREALAECSLNGWPLTEAARSAKDLKVFLEMHIEQGPVLESAGIQVGIVHGIAAPTRLQVRVQGKASHTGTTPMDQRHDAFLAAAEIGLLLEEAALAEKAHGTVGTVGACVVKPGAMNVVPDTAELKIDIRGTDVTSKATVLNKLYAAFRYVEEKRGVKVEWTMLSDEQPVLLSEDVLDSLERSCRSLGISYLKMASGAGHDAMNMARRWPTGLIFVPSKDGVSHHREEYTSWEQIGVGARLLEEEIKKWAVVLDADGRPLNEEEEGSQPNQMGESA